MGSENQRGTQNWLLMQSGSVGHVSGISILLYICEKEESFYSFIWNVFYVVVSFKVLSLEV